MFKVGDLVKCTSTGQPGNWLTFGKVYTVLESGNGYTNYMGDNGKEQCAYSWRFELVSKAAPQAAAIAGGLQEHSVGEYYPLAAVMYEHNGERIITIENLQTGEVNSINGRPINWGSFEEAYKRMESKPTTNWAKGRVSYVSGRWVVAEPANPVRVTRLRNMLHRG
ncbi:hypothetical protein HOU10_gp36 [Curvibacter phage P26059B]|uniref:Uncharacterized protein n=1 Tax=Curvibacter phage P26059B TaxID=1983784 RepID=A0A384UH49_9CAUD|nr:hypothetical protein HOU10_gp36 [Curvibacter phage P26059B]ASJ79312.1 hypothetical protein P26059B_0036 [Curvibacter phage P26059B]